VLNDHASVWKRPIRHRFIRVVRRVDHDQEEIPVRATVLYGPRDIRLDEVPDPTILRPTDAVVQVTASCVCGSDLWPYRGVNTPEHPQRIGHEFVGVVTDVGAEVRTVRAGDFVIAPFAASDGTCVHCRNGVHTSCAHGAWWGSQDEFGLPVDGGQGEAVRVPMADGTLVATPGQPDDALVPT
jgi:threonine dehydrogenase-like Zn-dependent dehydrogenase